MAVPSQTFTHSASTNAPLQAVWAQLDKPQTWEGISGIDRVFDPVIEEGKLSGFSFDTLIAGQRYAGSATPNARTENQVMAWNVTNSEIRGTTKVELDETTSGTLVTVTLDVSSSGFLSGMMFPMIASAISSGLPQAVDDFVAGLGESDTTDRTEGDDSADPETDSGNPPPRQPNTPF